MELLQTFEYERLKVETYYVGTNKLPNKVYLDGELIHFDQTYRPSPLLCIDEPSTMVCLLGFYVLRRGDVEDDYFDAMDCPILLEWAENDEEVRTMVNDWEMREDEDYLKDCTMTLEECSRIGQYITTH